MIPALEGKRLLIVEEGFFLDEETRAIFEASRTELIVVPGDEIGRILEHKGWCDAAILDINLDSEPAFDIVEQLEWLGVPYLFALSGPVEVGPGTSVFRLSRNVGELQAIADALFGKGRLH